MKRSCRILLALCLPLMLCGLALAQHSGPYVGGNVGGNALLTAEGTDSQGSFSLKFNPDLQWSIVAGWDFKPNNPAGEGRVELEYSHRSNQLDEVEFAGGNFPGSGDMTADSFLLNFIGIYRDRRIWAPYLLLGAGAARIEASDLKVSGQRLGSGSDDVFAYQVGCGIDLALTERLNLDLGYRFFGTTRPGFTEANGKEFKMDYYSHSALLGVRLGF